MYRQRLLASARTRTESSGHFLKTAIFSLSRSASPDNFDFEISEALAPIPFRHRVEGTRGGIAENGGVPEFTGERRHRQERFYWRPSPLAKEVEHGKFQRTPRGGIGFDLRLVLHHPHVAAFRHCSRLFAAPPRAATVNARAVSSVSPVTYGRGHDSPLPTAPSVAIASIHTVSVSARSAEAWRNATLKGMRSSVNRNRSMHNAAG